MRRRRCCRARRLIDSENDGPLVGKGTRCWGRRSPPAWAAMAGPTPCSAPLPAGQPEETLRHRLLHAFADAHRQSGRPERVADAGTALHRHHQSGPAPACHLAQGWGGTRVRRETERPATGGRCAITSDGRPRGSAAKGRLVAPGSDRKAIPRVSQGPFQDRPRLPGSELLPKAPLNFLSLMRDPLPRATAAGARQQARPESALQAAQGYGRIRFF